ncbi:MAG: ABC transporter ATP-binding protein [Oscillospiraceae bacterium]|nr:ABC transporter ATP-binding protein [Oscillospiraceae bacterium]
MNEKIILSARHLYKQYGKGVTAVSALNDVSLDIHTGEFVCVTGESGSGKTTLLNSLGSLDTPDSGEIFFDNQDITKKKDNELASYRRKSIGFIFQNYNLIPVLTVAENIVLPLNLDNTPPDTAYLDELLNLTGLTQKRNCFPHQLSGGQQQRTAFIRALIHKPKLILADEPTGNLDSKNSREIIAILKTSVAKYNQALVLISHDPAIAAQSDKIFIMKDGCMTEGR